MLLLATTSRSNTVRRRNPKSRLIAHALGILAAEFARGFIGSLFGNFGGHR